MGLLDKMLAKKGKTRADISPSSNIAKRQKANGVRGTLELERVLNLPAREWEEQDVELLQDEVSAWLKTPLGQQRLRPAQAFSLADLHDLEGLFGMILVGGGKTLITRLAPLVLESLTPILLVPANLRDKTTREFEDLDRHWQRHHDYEIVSYEKLGRVSGAEYLAERQPDLIVSDEVHKLKNRDAAVTRRVERYMNENPHTVFCALSGTVTKRSLMDYHHILRWCLGKDRMPSPALQSEAMEWARALDEKLRGVQRVAPGALRAFVHFTPGSKPSLKEIADSPEVTRDEARQGYGRRLRATPGIVATRASAVDASIVGALWEPDVPEDIRKHIEHLKEEYETPGGEMCRMPIDVWRHARELICGFYYKWDPEPPEAWLDARRGWYRYVREVLEEKIDGLDSPMQVAMACKRGYRHSGGKYDAWQAVRDTFKVKNVPVWVNTSVLEQVIARLPKKIPTLVWVEQIATGHKLSELSGIPFYSRGGLNKDKEPIEKLAGAGHAIVSISSNSTGRNLQAWHRNSVVSPPPNGAMWEQMVGRTHREGQEADEVGFDIMLGDASIREGMRQALRDSRYIEQSTGAPQKLLLAGIKVVEPTQRKQK